MRQRRRLYWFQPVNSFPVRASLGKAARILATIFPRRHIGKTGQHIQTRRASESTEAFFASSNCPSIARKSKRQQPGVFDAKLLVISAADQGHAIGQAILGVAYTQGRGGLQRDEYEAVKFLRPAANQGNPIGQAALGYFYEHGLGRMQKSLPTAISFYEKAAQQGNQIAIGSLKRLGRL